MLAVLCSSGLIIFLILTSGDRLEIADAQGVVLGDQLAYARCLDCVESSSTKLLLAIYFMTMGDTGLSGS